MTDVKATVSRIYSSTAVDSAGVKIGFLDSATKAAQNDTVTVTNANSVLWCILTIDADGTDEAVTLDGNEITLTDSTTGAVSGIVVYK